MAQQSMTRSQLIVVIVLPILVIIFCGYCAYKIFQTGNVEPKAGRSVTIKPYSKSDAVWGAPPASACSALGNVDVVTTPYTLIDRGNDLYGCSTPEIDIPNQKNKKTLQYVVTGFSDKATNLKLIMRIEGDQSSSDAIVAKKSWAIYAAVLSQTVFAQQMSESDMQSLANLHEGSAFQKNYNLQLISDAKYLNDHKKGVGVYTYEIRGLPVLSGE